MLKDRIENQIFTDRKEEEISRKIKLKKRWQSTLSQAKIATSEDKHPHPIRISRDVRRININERYRYHNQGKIQC